MTRDDINYYQINDNQWIKATDIYIYSDLNSLFRTHSDSYKHLINVNDKALNRGLAAGSDWKVDRVATINGDKYYRVATDEWVKATDVFEYKLDALIVDVNSNSNIYNDEDAIVGSINKGMRFKVDRTSNISNQQMYRVATNEYVLVTDTK